MKIVIRYLMRDKRRTIKTILCIAFSVALMFSLMQMGDVLKEEFQNMVLNGLHRDFTITHMTFDEIGRIKEMVVDDKGAVLYTIWIGDVDVENRATSATMLGLEGDLEYFKDCEMVSGRKPGTDGEREIMVSQSLSDALPEVYRVGNDVELKIMAEAGKERTEKFLVCGIFSDIRDEGDMIFTGLRTASDLIKQWGLPPDSGSNAAAVVVDKDEYDVEKIVDRILEVQEKIYPGASEEKDFFYRDRVLMNEEKSSLYEEEGTFSSVSDALKALMLVIAFGMMIFIYGAFRINAFRKIRYLGIMRCLGGDKKTLAGNIFGESMLIAHTGIFLGVAGGNVLNQFVAGKILRYLTNMEYDVTVKQMWSTYAGIYMVAIVPILLVTWKIWRDMGKIPPVHAIHYDNNSVKNKLFTSGSRISQKSEKYKNIIWRLSRRNLCRNRSESIVMVSVISITLTLVLLITNTFCIVDLSPRQGKRDFCRFEIMCELGAETENYFNEADKEKLNVCEGVKEVYAQYFAREFQVQAERDSIVVVYNDTLWQKLIEYNPGLRELDYREKAVAVAYSSEEFDVLDVVSAREEETGRQIGIPVTENYVGDQSLLGEFTENDEVIKIILNEKMAQKMGMETGRYTSMCIGTGQGFDASGFQNYVQDNFEHILINPLGTETSYEKQLLAIVILAGYICASFFVFLLAIIESMLAFHMLNRQREYGIMRALGMDRKSCVRFICAEGLQLEGYAVLISLVLSVPANCYLSSIVRDRIEISVAAYVASFVFLTLVIWIKSIVTVHKNMDTGIVAMIRNKE